MRWLTLGEVSEHMLEVPASTARNWAATGHLDGIVTKQVGAHRRYHPEAAWYFACHGEPAPSLTVAYEWAEQHPLPDIDHRGARLVSEAS